MSTRMWEVPKRRTTYPRISKRTGRIILFLWAPGGRSTSHETTRSGRRRVLLTKRASLMQQHLNQDVTGAHNMMYPVRQKRRASTHHRLPGRREERPDNGPEVVYTSTALRIRTKPQCTKLTMPKRGIATGVQWFHWRTRSSNRLSDDMAWITPAPLASSDSRRVSRQGKSGASW